MSELVDRADEDGSNGMPLLDIDIFDFSFHIRESLLKEWMEV